MEQVDNIQIYKPHIDQFSKSIIKKSFIWFSQQEDNLKMFLLFFYYATDVIPLQVITMWVWMLFMLWYGRDRGYATNDTPSP